MRILYREVIVTVGANSAPIVGANPKRCRLTIYPVSNIPVYVTAMQPAANLKGALVQQGCVPVVFGSGPQWDADGNQIATFADAIQGICPAGPTQVYAIEEWYA